MNDCTDHVGWLLDVYPGDQGAVVWLLGEDGQRCRLTHAFPMAFYAAGAFPRLRQLWACLQSHPLAPQLRRTRRLDLFTGWEEVMEINVSGPAALEQLFRHARESFPDLDYYDADIHFSLRYAALFGVFPLSRCRVSAGDGRIATITPLDSSWDIDPADPPLRVLSFAPDIDPSYRSPSRLIVANAHGQIDLPLEPETELLSSVQSLLRRHDPDLILTRWGDTWLFPLLIDIQRRTGAAYFNPSRDPARRFLRRRANSYFTYGQVVYRGQQVHLFGRWHIDEANAMMYAEYGLPGVLEQARVTGLPVQEIARKSPGAGITAMQMLTALRREVLIPYQKQQTERLKSALDLIHADRGGLVYRPIIGLHDDVAEIDFTSMYPSIMARFNISPESVGLPTDNAVRVPELGLVIDQTRDGLVPATLRPLLAKRIAIKRELAGMNPLDCRYKQLKARASALKWLLVVCFGYLGYKNARFGRIEGHEAVTAYGREMLLRAKEAAEDLGYTVLHLYVDGLWIRHPEGTAGRLDAVLAEIVQRTGLPICLEGVYRWIAFLPSRQDERVPVANRYFGVFQDGSYKIRGLEARRHDTPPFVARAQLRILETLAATEAPPETRLPVVVGMLRRDLADLRAGQVAPADLLVSQRVGRAVEAYKVQSPAALALIQLQAAGKTLEPGRRVRFVYTLDEPGVYAWGSFAELDPARIDAARYADLLLRAASALLQPFIAEAALRQWVAGTPQQLRLDFRKRGSVNRN